MKSHLLFTVAILLLSLCLTPGLMAQGSKKVLNLDSDGDYVEISDGSGCISKSSIGVVNLLDEGSPLSANERELVIF